MNCPNCSNPNGVREIIYGLPIQPIDETQFAIGGCCVTDMDPSHLCVICGFEFTVLES